MVEPPHPASVICLADGRAVPLKVHQCSWSGDFQPNSLDAILECYRVRVARAEIDIAALADRDFLVVHDVNLALGTTGSGLVANTSLSAARDLRLLSDGGATNVRPPLFSEVCAAIADESFPTLLELDLKDWLPWPWPRVEELVRMIEPVKDKVIFGGGADWNLRRLQRVDPTVPVGFNFAAYFDWVAEDEEPDELPGVRGAYGYLDAHPLARERLEATADYVRERLDAILRLVPGSREIHLRLSTFERMLDDGVDDLVDIVHRHKMLLDVWTLNAGTPHWQERLRRALAAGVDVVTSDTPHMLAASAAAA